MATALLRTELAFLDGPAANDDVDLVDSLEARIAQRKRALERQHERQQDRAILHAFLLTPSTAPALSLVDLERNDARLQQLQASLAQARSSLVDDVLALDSLAWPLSV